jgi:hypothetical protein
MKDGRVQVVVSLYEVVRVLASTAGLAHVMLLAPDWSVMLA